MKKAFIYALCSVMAASTISTTVKAAFLVSGTAIGPGGQIFRFFGWIDPVSGHGNITWSSGGSSGTIVWKKADPNSDIPLPTQASKLEELTKIYTIEGENDGAPIDLNEYASLIVDVYNQANMQASQK
ncbi:MAG: hypothetical protein J0I41_23140 [Filimonas sp.]|nr:hypothetical protein [Filimonas sp.]